MDAGVSINRHDSASYSHPLPKKSRLGPRLFRYRAKLSHSESTLCNCSIDEIESVHMLLDPLPPFEPVTT